MKKQDAIDTLKILLETLESSASVEKLNFSVISETTDVPIRQGCHKIPTGRFNIALDIQLVL